jgi:hypothetical protein
MTAQGIPQGTESGCINELRPRSGAGQRRKKRFTTGILNITSNNIGWRLLLRATIHSGRGETGFPIEKAGRELRATEIH